MQTIAEHHRYDYLRGIKMGLYTAGTAANGQENVSEQEGRQPMRWKRKAI